MTLIKVVIVVLLASLSVGLTRTMLGAKADWSYRGIALGVVQGIMDMFVGWFFLTWLLGVPW